MPENSFAERFKRLEPADLLGIINKPEDYQPSAVEAARDELASRQLTQQELDAAKKICEERLAVEHAKSDRIDQLKVKAATIVEELSPVQFGPQPQDKYIRNITIFVAVYFLYMVYRNIWFFGTLEKGIIHDWTEVFFIVPLIWLPVAGILFGLKRRWGWILLTAFFCKIIVGGMIYIFVAGISSEVAQGILASLAFGAALYAITREHVRKVFDADRSAFIASVVIGCIAGFFPWLQLIAYYFN